MTGFEHRASFYEGLEGFFDAALPFVRDGLSADAAIMVAVDRSKIARLRAELGEDAGRVTFVDMGVLGRNPGRIIPAWEAFLSDPEHAGRPVRGIGEPVWAQRTAEELVECQLHESLLNLAFADAPDFILLCPYDTTALAPAVVHEARCGHPVVVEARTPRPSRQYRGDASVLAPFDVPLPPPSAAPAVVGFDRSTLAGVRRTVADHGEEAGLDRRRTDDLVLAVNEVASNSLRHGGGHGVLRVWRDDGAVVCEIRDGGRIEEPLIGRRVPRPHQVGGWGVWMAHQVADLLQLRSSSDGTVVRVHMRVAA